MLDELFTDPTEIRKGFEWWHIPLQKIITSGQIPRHVAFIMDGNRRFARKTDLESIQRGHEKGCEQMFKILGWCHEIGIKEVTLYSFSIENFKRSNEEVNGLMQLTEKILTKLVKQKERMETAQIRYRVYGNMTMLSPNLRELVGRLQRMTKHYAKGQVNFCFAYTAQDDMNRAFEWIRKGVEKGLIQKNQIDEWLISRCLDTAGSEPDLLIRTSGELRLSDFLLWQCSNCHVYFDEDLWPEFNFVNLCKAILSYQMNIAKIDVKA
ncbi:hypothetical protein WR25_14116 isoform D [Diploscapter pachys]|uniref:Alkyl transferase n=2 Tax=Diploscapter pachys TaxID=2018661 RepID=A0A2A2KPI2_9BILA|nr:hypothetical protein WR25_14116 isoform D [Diploscapter pachys]